MSNNFQNLFIILAIAGIILYVSNMRQKHQENFSVLNKLISGIDNMSEAELEEYEKKIANDNDEEKLISDLNKASELIGEDYDMDDEDEMDSVKPIEEEEMNYAMIEEELNEEEFKRRLAGESVNSNIIGDKLSGESGIFNENIAEKQLEEEEEFRRFLGGEMPENERQEFTEEENKILPFAEEENAYNLSEEEGIQEEIRNRLMYQEEEEMNKREAAKRIIDEENIFEEERLTNKKNRQDLIQEELMFEEERLDKISANQQFLREEQLLEEERLNHTNSRQKIIRDEQEERKRIMMERTVEEEELDEEYRGIVDEEEYTQERDMYLRDEAEEEVKFREEHIQEEERYRLSEEDEFMHPEAKQEMKDRLRYQVNCGTFIDPKYKSRIDACGTKANLKLKKPFNKKLQDVMNSRAGDMPKSIRQVYDELATDEINKDAETVCQHVQKGVSMKSCSNKYNMIGEEDESITDTLRANDSCFDPYSQY